MTGSPQLLVVDDLAHIHGEELRVPIHGFGHCWCCWLGGTGAGERRRGELADRALRCSPFEAQGTERCHTCTGWCEPWSMRAGVVGDAVARGGTMRTARK